MSTPVTGSDGLPLIGGPGSNIPLPVPVGTEQVSSRNLDTISALGFSSDATTKVSALEYQASVHEDIQSFILALLQMAQGDSAQAQLILNILGVSNLPSIDAINGQYATDAALLQAAQDQITAYNDYLSNLNAAGSQLDSDGNAILQDQTQLQGQAAALQTLYNQYQALVASADLSTSAGQASFADAVNALISQASGQYSSNVVAIFTNLTASLASYQASINAYNNTIGSPGVSQSSWDAVNASIAIRNQFPTINSLYGTVPSLPTFPGVSTDSLTSPGAVSGPAAITWPTVDAGQLGDSGYVTTINNAISGAFAAAINESANAEADAGNLTGVINANAASAGSVGGTPIDDLVIPTADEYVSNILNTIYNSFNQEALGRLLGLLGIQSSGTTQALLDLITRFKLAPSISLTNPSGFAVTGATISQSAPSQVIQTFVVQFAKFLNNKVLNGQTAEGASVKTPVEKTTGIPSGVIGAADALTVPDTSPSSNLVALSAGGTTLAADFLSLLGQFAVLAAGVLLQSDQHLEDVSAEDLATALSASLLTLTGSVSSDDLKARVAALVAALPQNAGASSADLQAQTDAASELYDSFLAAFRAQLANAVIGSNFSTAAIGAQISAAYVQSTFKEVDRAAAQQKVILAEHDKSQQNLEELVANLPTAAYLTGPSGVASSAAGGQNSSSVAAALASNLPKDANGNYGAVNPTELYTALSSGLDPQAANTAFVHFVQNEPDYQLSVAQASKRNQAAGGELNAHLQANVHQTLTDYANEDFFNSLTVNSDKSTSEQFATVARRGLDVAQQINNPSLANFYEHHLLTGLNTLDLGIQVRKDALVNTPQVRATTIFPV